MQGGSATFVKTAQTIGRIVQAEVQMMKLKSANRKEWQRLQTSNNKLFLVSQNARRALNESSWSSSVQVVDSPHLPSDLCFCLPPHGGSGLAGTTTPTSCALLFSFCERGCCCCCVG